MECLLRYIYPLQILNVLVNVLKAVGVPEARRTRINTACLEPTTVERNAPPPEAIEWIPILYSCGQSSVLVLLREAVQRHKVMPEANHRRRGLQLNVSYSILADHTGHSLDIIWVSHVTII